MPPSQPSTPIVLQRYLPIYDRFFTYGRSILYTRTSFRKFSEFPDGPILFRTDKSPTRNLGDLQRAGIRKKNFWIIPQKSKRPKEFGIEYKEFLQKLFFSYTWWYISSKVNFAEDGILSFDLGETVREKLLGVGDYLIMEYKPGGRAIPCLHECEIEKQIAIPPRYLFEIAKLNRHDFRKVGFFDFFLDMRAMGLAWGERKMYRYCKFYEMLMKKLFDILAEKKRLKLQ